VVQVEKEAALVDSAVLKAPVRKSAGDRFFGALEAVFRKFDDAKKKIDEKVYLDDARTHLVLSGLWATTLVIQDGSIYVSGATPVEIVPKAAVVIASSVAGAYHAWKYIDARRN
jgi:hypothetical protein